MIGLQEQLLAFRVSVGLTDALNVKHMFFEDLIELSRHLQVKQLYTKSHNECKTTFNAMKGYQLTILYNLKINLEIYMI